MHVWLWFGVCTATPYVGKERCITVPRTAAQSPSLILKIGAVVGWPSPYGVTSAGTRFGQGAPISAVNMMVQRKAHTMLVGGDLTVAVGW
jgi:hypothetical protein